MANDSEENVVFPPAMFAEQLQRASEQFSAQQRAWFEQMMGGWASSDGALGELTALSTRAAVFKTRVQSGGRISVPDAEREALGIEEGDLVQAFVVPIERGESE